MKALLIIGMQVDLLPGGPAEVPDSHKLVPLVHSIAEKFDLVAAANYAMPADHLAFAANHPWRRPGQVIGVAGTPTLLRHISCVPHTFGAEFIPGLKTSDIAFIADMGAEPALPPHSAFFDVEKKRATGLLAFLTEKKVTELYIAGMPLEDEVKNSALDSQATGFATFLVQDVCRGRSPVAAAATLAELENVGVRLISSHQI